MTKTLTATKERPILFNRPMVRAILEGRKTQTRRPLPARFQGGDAGGVWLPGGGRWQFGDEVIPNPFGAPGDHLYVRETHAFVTCDKDGPGAFYGPDRGIYSDYGEWFYVNYAADPGDITWDPPNFRPSIHMPRWASRLTLEVVSAYPQELTDMRETEAMAEGVERWPDSPYWKGGPHAVKGHPKSMPSALEAFRDLWDSIYVDRCPWGAGSWVWVVEFKVVAPESGRIAGGES